MRSDDDRIADILEAADLISSAVKLGRERFDADHFVQSAVIRWIQIIGEAASRLSPAARAARPEVSWRGAAAMRNRTVHGYFDIDLDLVWEAASVSVPDLAMQLRSPESP